MKKLVFLLLTFGLFSGISAQKTNEQEVALMFSNVKTKLTEAEKEGIFKKMGLALSRDKKQFVIAGDPDALDYPFTVAVFPLDLNKDQKEELFVLYGNTYTSGNTGGNVVLFVKDKAGVYRMNFGFSGVSPSLLPTKNLGYPDVLIGGPGFEFPVWRWNGKEYAYNRKITDKAFGKLKFEDVEPVSKSYQASIN